MADEARREILRALEEGMQALLESLETIDEASAKLRPRAESWSVLECVQHVAVTEALMLACLREARASDASHEDRAREAKFQDLALNRARRIEAPEAVAPRGDGEMLPEAFEKFRAARRETVQFVEEFPGEMRCWLTKHPLITRPVNCYEMLLLMALHPRRHAQQIAEIREHLSERRSQRM